MKDNNNNWNPKKDAVYDPEIHGPRMERQRTIDPPKQETTLPPKLDNPAGLSRQNSRASDASPNYMTPKEPETPLDEEYKDATFQKSKIQKLAEEHKVMEGVVEDLKKAGIAESPKYFNAELNAIKEKIYSQAEETAKKQKKRQEKQKGGR